MVCNKCYCNVGSGTVDEEFSLTQLTRDKPYPAKYPPFISVLPDEMTTDLMSVTYLKIFNLLSNSHHDTTDTVTEKLALIQYAPTNGSTYPPMGYSGSATGIQPTKLPKAAGLVKV